MTNKTSVFLNVPANERLLETDHFFVIKDKYPVSPGHCLIVSKEYKQDFFDLLPVERQELVEAIGRVRQLIEGEHSPDGFNIGINCGRSAGQTVMHFHCHVIPRYAGDVERPDGGIRHCVAGKGFYSATKTQPPAP